jgi:hypothetical protein
MSKLEKVQGEIRGLLIDGNAKAALRLAQQTVKKNKNSSWASALHALALDANGKRSEAIAVVEKILKAKSLDRPCLALLQHLLSGMGKGSDIHAFFSIVICIL